MDISILAVGRNMPDWINFGIREYMKRLGGEIRINLVEITAARRGAAVNVEQTLAREAEKIRTALPSRGHYIVLDEKGKRLSTRDLSAKLNTWLLDGLAPGIVLGGADGLHASIKNGAAEIWSLSDMTLPHALARVIIVEQIYRAWTILKGHPYHRR